VLELRLAAGAKLAVVVLGVVTVPLTAVEPWARVKVEVVMVVGSMGTLKVTDRPLLRATPVAAAAGTTAVTAGVTTITAAGELELVAGVHPTNETAKIKAGRKNRKECMVVPLGTKILLFSRFVSIIHHF
jgi:hypothetical protein